MFFFTVLVLNLIITSSASECIDNDKYDCEGLNALIDICNDTQKAINVCPEFCGLCHLVDVDGGWGSWSEWTHCSVTCEQGIIERHRTCSNPMPANDGLNCTGDFYESKECFTAAPCPVNGNWSEWSQWGSCSTSCEVGIQSRTRTCTNPKPDSLGDYCSGPNFDVKLCDNGPCSDGGWSSWSSWTPCTTKCGYGTKTQSRTCTNPKPSPHGSDCVGNSMRVDTCYDFTDCLHSIWSEWSQWDSCSTSCEAGIQSRTRACTNPKPESHGDCSGSNMDTRLCDNGPCSDGEWSSWSSWTPCSTKCGYGIKTQSRTCTNPTPSPHGNDCVGNSMRVDTCFVITDTSKYADCSEVKAHCGSAADGIYHVTLWNTKRKIQVYCDMTTNGGGWTVFQYRYNGEVDFYRNFAEYVKGFGDLRTEFWLGLDYVEEISSQYKSQLRVDLISANGTTAFEVFDKFSLGASPEYTLHVGSTLSSHNIGSSGSLHYHKDMPFSTYDNDVDKNSGNCASTYHGAWWYKSCHNVNLNGKYLIPGVNDAKGIFYYSFLGSSSLKETRISFRRSPT